MLTVVLPDLTYLQLGLTEICGLWMFETYIAWMWMWMCVTDVARI